jgi:hypothetical protein
MKCDSPSFTSRAVTYCKTRGYRRKNKCGACGIDVAVATDFRNAESVREWGISKLCQDCQDAVFGLT